MTHVVPQRSLPSSLYRQGMRVHAVNILIITEYHSPQTKSSENPGLMFHLFWDIFKNA
jgi:hypothetical protein